MISPEPRFTTKRLIRSHNTHFPDDYSNYNFLTKSNNAMCLLAFCVHSKISAVNHLQAGLIKSKCTNLPRRGPCAHSTACPTFAYQMCTGWNMADTLDNLQCHRIHRTQESHPFSSSNKKTTTEGRHMYSLTIFLTVMIRANIKAISFV